ncbi:MAG: AMP-binding protein [candidate division Zixibacteria bacterium]|nr:AMP-binding protein [candidate division Zixibacteria bacterium]
MINTKLTPINKLNLPQMLAQSRKEFGTNVAMRYFDGERFRELTYDGFYRMVMQAISALRKAGVKSQDKVGILSENRPHWGAAYFANLFNGGINVPLDALLKPQELPYIIHHSGIKVIVASAKYIPDLETIKDKIESLETIITMDPGDSAYPYLLADDNPPILEPPGTSLDELAAVIYTSGTTGLAKGVMLSHGNITSDIWAMVNAMDLYESDNFISILPLHHTFECTCGFLTPISFGSCITYARGLASKQIVEDIKNNKATILLGVPLVFEKMFTGLSKEIAKKPQFTRAIFKTTYGLSKIIKKTVKLEAGGMLFSSLREKAGLSSLRLMVAGGAPMIPEIAEAFNIMGFRLIQGYGLTESAPVLTLNPYENYRNDSIGKPLPGVTLKIDNPNSQGIGEIIAKGPMVMKGYYKNPEATATVLKDGWLYTGDLGWGDDDGFYYIAGRSKNVIVTPGGKNVYPEEIEFALNRSPFILESLVMGRPLESGGGEEIEAIIVPDMEYYSARAAEKGIDLNEMNIEKTIKLEVSKQCQELADYKRVKYVMLRNSDFEKTSTRKIKRFLYYNKELKVPSGQKKR